MKTVLTCLFIIGLGLTACNTPNTDTDAAGYEHHNSHMDTMNKKAVDTPDDAAQDGGAENSKDHGTNTGYDVPD